MDRTPARGRHAGLCRSFRTLAEGKPRLDLFSDRVLAWRSKSFSPTWARRRGGIDPTQAGKIPDVAWTQIISLRNIPGARVCRQVEREVLFRSIAEDFATSAKRAEAWLSGCRREAVLKSLALLVGGLLFCSSGHLGHLGADTPVDALQAALGAGAVAVHRVRGMQVHLRDEARVTTPRHWCCCTAPRPACTPGRAGPARSEGQRRVIQFDLPGFALTGPHPQDDYSIAAYVRFVVAVMDQLGVQRFVLAGNSLGGRLRGRWRTPTRSAWRSWCWWMRRAMCLSPSRCPLAGIARSPLLQPLMRNTLPRGLVERSVRNVWRRRPRSRPIWWTCTTT